MPKLQKHKTKNKDVSGNPRQYWGYHITIPKDVAQTLHLADNQKLFARLSQNSKRMIYSQRLTNNTDIPITVDQFLTKRYKQQDYYSIKVTVPAKFVKLLNLQKNQEIDIQAIDQNIILML